MRDDGARIMDAAGADRLLFNTCSGPAAWARDGSVFPTIGALLPVPATDVDPPMADHGRASASGSISTTSREELGVLQ